MVQTLERQHAARRITRHLRHNGEAYRPRPYIYPEGEIAQIVAAAARLPSDYGLRGLTCSTAFGLMAVTGLRISEAIGLEDRDIDLDAAVVVVRKGNNGKSRFLPIAACTVERLGEYRQSRNRFGRGDVPYFFQSEEGKRLSDCGLRYNFDLVSQRIGLHEPQPFKKHGRGPRIHDLRHTFAVRTIFGGTGKEGMQTAKCRNSARIWVMRHLKTPIGISKPCPNCSDWRPNPQNSL